MVKVDPILPPLPKTSDSMKYSFWAGASSSGSPHAVPLPPVLSIIQLCSPQSHFIHPCNYLIYLYPQGPELNRSREPWARSQQSLPSPLGADFSCPHTFIRCVLRALTLHNDPFQQQLPPPPPTTTTTLRRPVISVASSTLSTEISISCPFYQ